MDLRDLSMANSRLYFLILSSWLMLRLISLIPIFKTFASEAILEISPPSRFYRWENWAMYSFNEYFTKPRCGVERLNSVRLGIKPCTQITAIQSDHFVLKDWINLSKLGVKFKSPSLQFIFSLQGSTIS